MMRYNKHINGDYITAIGTGDGGVEITKAEFDELLSIIKAKPTPAEGYGFRLRVDLAWEEYELPPIKDRGELEISDDEALKIILGEEEV